MRRPRWNTLPVILNALLALLGAVAVTFAAIRVVEDLAAAPALERVRAGQADVQNSVATTGLALQNEAADQAQRPALLDALAADDTAALRAYFVQTLYDSKADAMAVVSDGAVLASAGPAVSWPAAALEGYSFVSVPEGLALIAGAPLPAPWTGTLYLSRRLSGQWADAAGAGQGVDVRVRPVTGLPSNDAYATLRTTALRLKAAQAAWVRPAEAFVAAGPLLGPDGAVIGVIETTLWDGGVQQTSYNLRRTLLPMGLGLGALAALLNAVLSMRVAGPITVLTGTARRIGEGDLSTPVAALPDAQTGSLALALEEMRRRLLELTANLKRQQAESSAILSGIVEGVFTVDSERRIRYLNPQAAGLLGTGGGPERLIGRFCGDVLLPLPVRGRRPCEDQCPILHARFQPGARATEHLALPGGRRNVIVTSAPPVQSGGPAGAELQVVVLRDETEVEATRRLRDTVLANISHEFRTPLSAQLASIELLLDQLPELNTDQIAGLVVSLQSGTLRLTQLIDNLLESVRIESGHDQVRRLPVPLDEVVEQAVEMIRPLLDQRGQQLEVDLPYPFPQARGDAPRLVQVLVNLLANANKYAPAGTTIRVGGHAEAGTVAVWVEDEGPGLPDLPTEALFGRFVRAGLGDPDNEGASANNAGGTGLGLWIVQSIVARHGGRVTAENTGHGTRVRVTLPRAQMDLATP